jgi:hypothetical protein
METISFPGKLHRITREMSLEQSKQVIVTCWETALKAFPTGAEVLLFPEMMELDEDDITSILSRIREDFEAVPTANSILIFVAPGVDIYIPMLEMH